MTGVYYYLTLLDYLIAYYCRTLAYIQEICRAIAFEDWTSFITGSDLPISLDEILLTVGVLNSKFYSYAYSTQQE
jgi:hypothetical protein